MLVENDADLRPALMQVLTRAGYDVVVATSAEQAQRLMAQRTFNRIYTDGTLPLDLTPSSVPGTSAVAVEDREDGTARVRMDQVLPWPVTLKLLDLLQVHADTQDPSS